MAAERTARVEGIIAHRPGLRSLLLALPGETPFVARPGQFLSLLLPVGERPPLTRAYSIASPAGVQPLELCLDRVPGGAGSAYLHGLEVGATLCWTGPWGTFVLDQAPDAEAVFVAEGTAVAAIRPMLHRAAATARHPLHLLYAHDHGLYRDELARLPGLSITDVAVADLEAETRRRWVEADRDRSRHFFVCGIGEQVHRLRDLLRGAGYARRAVQYERW